MHAWEKAHTLAKRVIALASSLGRGEAADIVRRQMIRAATSAPANIAEGHGGSRGRAYRRFLLLARGSATELDYWLLLAGETVLVGQSDTDELRALTAEVIAMLTTMIRQLPLREGQASE